MYAIIHIGGFAIKIERVGNILLASTRNKFAMQFYCIILYRPPHVCHIQDNTITVLALFFFFSSLDRYSSMFENYCNLMA